MLKVKAILVFLMLSLSLAAFCKEESGTIFPGETIKIMDIQLSWVFPEQDQAKPETLRNDIVFLDIKGPQTNIKELAVPGIEDRDGVRNRVCLAIDGVVLEFDPNYRGVKIESLRIDGFEQNPVREIDGNYHKFDLYVSSISPVSLNKWELTVSDNKELFPEGSRYYMLSMRNTKTSEKSEIALTHNSYKMVGRFTISFGKFYTSTKTAFLRCKADKDPSVRGMGAFIEEFKWGGKFCQEGTIQEFFNILSEKYGFEVIWKEYPGYPESVDYMKNLEAVKGYNLNNQNTHIWTGISLQRLVAETCTHKSMDYTWKTPTTLELSYRKYNKVLEEKKKREEYLERKNAILEQFRKEYALLPKAYILKNITPEAAKALLESELSTYCVTENRIKIISIKEKKNISSSDKIIESAEEWVVTDSKSNSLILTATTKTHEKFRKKIQSIDSLLEQTEPASSVKPHKIKLELLLGAKSSEHKNAPSEDLLKMAQQFGISPKDVELFGFDTLKLEGRAFAWIVPEKGEIGKAMVSLGNAYATLEFLDLRDPFLVLKTSLGIRTPEIDATLFENTLYLEPGKTSTVGVTNMDNAYILAITPESPK